MQPTEVKEVGPDFSPEMIQDSNRGLQVTDSGARAHLPCDGAVGTGSEEVLSYMLYL